MCQKLGSYQRLTELCQKYTKANMKVHLLVKEGIFWVSKNKNEYNLLKHIDYIKKTWNPKNTEREREGT